MTRRWLVTCSALLALTGCSKGAGSPPTATPTTTVDLVNQCAMQLQYWAQQSLGNAKDTGLDYQEMGLSGDQYDALRALLDEARKQPSGRATPSWLLDQAKASCARLAAKPKSTTSGLGWP